MATNAPATDFSEAEVRAFADKLGEWADRLTDRERAILVSAAGPLAAQGDDVTGYAVHSMNPTVPLGSAITTVVVQALVDLSKLQSASQAGGSGGSSSSSGTTTTSK